MFLFPGKEFLWKKALFSMFLNKKFTTTLLTFQAIILKIREWEKLIFQ